jgi:hypothetical protein
MQTISQAVSPLLGGTPGPYQTQQASAVPLGLLALAAQQQQEAPASVVQNPALTAQEGIDGIRPGDDLFTVSGRDIGAGAFRDLISKSPRFSQGGKLGAVGMAIDAALSSPMPFSGGRITTSAPDQVLDRSQPIPDFIRTALQKSNPSQLRRMEAYQNFDAAMERINRKRVDNNGG